jgi:hypothetical protein
VLCCGLPAADISAVPHVPWQRFWQRVESQEVGVSADRWFWALFGSGMQLVWQRASYLCRNC